MKQIAYLLALFLFTAMPFASADDRVVPSSRGEMTYSFAPVVKRTAPAVVNVYAKQIVASRRESLFDDPFFRRFFGEEGGSNMPRERARNSLGSGVIVGAGGLVVTNNHVIQNASDIRVALSDRREFEAKLLLADERSDLAVLQLQSTGDEQFPTLPMADPDDLEVGDLVLAIGNPFGVGQTVTSGIVSALARTQVGVTDYQFFIQTDAAINPGNSGGALVNMRGELVGINTAIFSRSGGSIGIGFSIPTDMVQTVVQSAATGKRVTRPWLGAEFQDVTADIAESLGFPRPEGALIVGLHPRSPLVAAGLKRGDVIIAIDDKVVESARELGYRVGTSRIGETRIIEFQRQRKRMESQVRMMAAPETVPRDLSTIGGNSPFTGLVIANLSPAVAEEVDMPSDAEGIVVMDIKQGPAARFFRKGDVVRGLNGEPTPDVATLKQLLRKPQEYWDISVLRGSQTFRLRLG